MPRLPRLAVGALWPCTGPVLAIWAMLAHLRSQAASVQPFHAQGCFSPHLAGAALTGRLPRHLDSWLMTRDICRELFAHGASGCDLALVEGCFADDCPSDTAATPLGSSLCTLCDWLDLPRLAVVDADQMRDCSLPRRPERLDGVLLQATGSRDSAQRIRTQVETLWGLPVLGTVVAPETLTAALQDAASGGELTAETATALAQVASVSVDWNRLWALAGRRPLPVAAPALFATPAAPLHGIRVAIAYDDALCCYFPDVLELLELRGALVSDFSPLKDDRLPADADVVYLGCGHPERFAAQLAANDCLKSALRQHFRAGRRVYAEGGAAALLAETLACGQAQRHAMAGLLPMTAQHVPSTLSPAPVETVLCRDSWLGPAGTPLRGYLNPRWDFQIPEAQADLTLTADDPPLLWGRKQAIVSRVHLNFSVLPSALAGITAPALASSIV